MCVQCVMGAAAGFGIFQAYRFVVAARARKLLGSQQGSPEAMLAVQDPSSRPAADRAEGAAPPTIMTVQTAI